MDVCRICLTKKPEKNILQLQVDKNDDKTSYAEILLFCLNIEVEQDSKISSKICLKCHKKVIAFHKFKSLALENDAYLRSLDVKNEVFIREDEFEIKTEQLTTSDESQDTVLKVELTNDDVPCLKTEDQIDSIIESDDEFLSAIKKIKYEYVEEKTEENVPKKKRKKVLPKTKSISKTSSHSKQVCEECGKTVNDLKAHSYLHMPVTVRKRIKCHQCDKLFSSHSARYKHNKIKHLGLKEICNICNKAVTQLSQHIKVMHNRESLPHKCLECGRRFISNSLLELHMRQHTKDKPFACEVCDKKFANKSLMVLHRRSVHDKEKPHLCQLCSKSFFKKYHLQMHLMSHTKDKKFECPDCGKFYKTDRTLVSHRETHGVIRNYACQLCSQAFVRKAYLRVHMKSHIKDKRYPCQYCGVKFHRSDHRKRHEYTAHQKHLIASTTAST